MLQLWYLQGMVLCKAAVELDRVVRARQSDLALIFIGSGNVEVVSSFCYLESLLECHGGLNEQLTARASHAAARFGAIHKPVFSDGLFIVYTIVYKAVVLGVLFHAVETWPIKQRELYILWRSSIIIV